MLGFVFKHLPFVLFFPFRRLAGISREEMEQQDRFGRAELATWVGRGQAGSSAVGGIFRAIGGNLYSDSSQPASCHGRLYLAEWPTIRVYSQPHTAGSIRARQPVSVTRAGTVILHVQYVGCSTKL